ncbi:CDT1-like protein a, chloroplastic [Pyrus x bretschneideri]|uniref:CDT1-like protein a, chloroplastic n=1 Tax=Pyrus x bretschneideri TaxID=225117 RepID=UPI00202DD4DC|nr:CDT1-like protein a, chloroplastic [Pyrus x bretschneideri]
MSSSAETFRCETPVSKTLNPEPQIRENETLSSKTPEKPPQLRRGARSRNVALPIEQVRRSAAKSLLKSTQKKQLTDEIASWPDKTPLKTRVRRSVQLPEKYEMLGEFFNCLDISIGRLRKKGLKSNFTNISPVIEHLTDRRFTYTHLAQLKFILPEVIEIKKMVVWDEKTSRRKPDLHISMNIHAVPNDGKLKSEGGGIMRLRKAFRKRLADISKSYPEDYEIPEEILPYPFNHVKEHMHSDTVKFPASSSPGEVLSSVCTVKQAAVSTICLQGDAIPDEMHLMTSNQSKGDLNSDINETPTQSVPIKTSFETPKKQQSAIEGYLSRSFQRHSFQKVTRTETQSPKFSVPESNFSAFFSTEEISTAASSYGQVPATPTKERDHIENDDGLPKTGASIGSTPEKVASTPARLMTTTPALHPPKRCYMNPNDNSTSSPNKLFRRCSRSLNFDTPVKNKMLSPGYISTSSTNKLVGHPPCSRSLKINTPVMNKLFEEKVLVLDAASLDSDISNILSEGLLQSIKDKERKAKERNAAILQAKRRQQMISSLPELFNMIHFLFQSMNCSFMKKEDLVEKLIFSHSDIVDEGEVEEHLKLLLELVPEWISEKFASGIVIKINKLSNPESIRARLEEAK